MCCEEDFEDFVIVDVCWIECYVDDFCVVCVVFVDVVIVGIVCMVVCVI